MTWDFQNPRGFEYEEGKLLLGMVGLEDETNKMNLYPIGVKTNRHAITFAGSGAGKGIGVICNNLMLWPHNALVIDPKGEAAEITVQRRLDMGQKVHVIDPYGEAKISDDLRASFNPLEHLDPNNPNIVEEIEIIVDGLIIRSNDGASVYWENGGAALIAGLIAYIILDAPDEHKNLIKMREMLTNKTELDECLHYMENITECGGLCQAAHSAVTAEEGKYFVSNAQGSTRWLDSLPMENTLKTSSFHLNDLKRGKCSVYLVLPLNYLNVRGQFLRLFVRCAMNEMARRMPDGELKGSNCLFFLDEFYSLGKIDEIPKGFGTMRAYGLQLWPILQDVSQLIKIYGQESAQTFFSNSDIHQYFGNTDPHTLKHLTERFGVKTLEDMPSFYYEDDPMFDDLINPDTAALGFGSESTDRQIQQDMRLRQKWRDDAKRNYDIEVNHTLGKPRISPDRMEKMIAPRVDKWACGSFVFTPNANPLYLQLLPYFWLDMVEGKIGKKIPCDGDVRTITKENVDNPVKTSDQKSMSRHNDDPWTPIHWVIIAVIAVVVFKLVF